MHHIFLKPGCYMNPDSLPIDLITEILLRLPTKSIARFYCLSKLWASVLRRPYFTELFLTRSSAQPRILFAIEQLGVWSFFSIPQHLNSYEKSSSSLVVAAKFHMNFPPENLHIYHHTRLRFACSHAAGLIYFYGMSFKEGCYDGVPVICNPNTRQYATLPYRLRYGKCYNFFGFDPIDKQFKVLFMASPGCSHYDKILTLETGTMRWREIECPLPHNPLGEGICIDGVIYYLGECRDWVYKTSDYVIVCFDVRSEKFKFIYIQSYCKLINYKGKLCVYHWEDDDIDWKKNVNDAIMLRVSVLEDAEKEIWSKYVYNLWDDNFFVDDKYVLIDVVGVTNMGEIILSMCDYTSKQRFYVFYFNPEKNTLQRVEIQGFGEYYHKALTEHSVYMKPYVYTIVDHIEDLNVNNPKLLNSKIYAPYVKTEVEESGEN